MAADFTQVKLLVCDFDGVFTDNKVYVSQDGTESVRCDRGDTVGLKRMRELGIDLVVISQEQNPVVQHRCAKIGVTAFNGIDDKLGVLERLCKEQSIALEDICYLGNDVNDAECLKAVGLPAVVADAHESVKRLAAYVSPRKGGDGAVRDVIAKILSAQDKPR